MKHLLASATLLWLAAVAAAQERTCVVRTVDGRELRGVVTADSASLRVGDERLALDEVLTVDQSPFVSERRALAMHRVWLRSGEALSVQALAGRGGEEDAPPVVMLTLPAAAEPVPVPLRYLAAIRMERKDGLTAPTFDRDRADPHATQDYLYVENEGRVRRFSVTILRLDGTRLHFALGGRDIEYDLQGVVAIVFGANSGVAPDPQPRPRATLTTRTGGRLSGRLLALDDAVRLRMDEGGEVSLPREVVRRIDFVTDKLVYLSDLEPAIEQTPALDRTWPVYVDRSPAGPYILLGGQSYERGLVVVPRTRLTYELDGSYDRLEMVLGIEDRAGPQAHAIVRVLADGKPVFESEPLTRGGKPLALRLDIQGARTLTLEADFGKNLDLGDYCVFADARIVQG